MTATDECPNGCHLAEYGGTHQGPPDCDLLPRDPEWYDPAAPPAEPRITLDDRSRAVMLCPFRLCDWQSDDTRTMTIAGQDAVARWHLLDEHREQLATLAQLAGAPAGVCARPHPSHPRRWCTEPRGHIDASHGDGKVDRWLLR